MDYSQYSGVPQPGYFSAYTFEELESIYSQSVGTIAVSQETGDNGKGRARKDGARRVSQGTSGVMSLDEYGNAFVSEPARKRAKKPSENVQESAPVVAPPPQPKAVRGKKRSDIAYIPFDFPQTCTAFQGNPGAFSTNEQLRSWLEWVLPLWDVQRETSLKNHDFDSLAIPVRNAQPRSSRTKAAPEPVLKSATTEKMTLPSDQSLPDWWQPKYIGNPYPQSLIPKHWQSQVVRAWDVVTRLGYMWDIDMSLDISLHTISLTTFIEALTLPKRSYLLDLIMCSLLRISARNTTLPKLKRKILFEHEEANVVSTSGGPGVKKKVIEKEHKEEEEEHTFEEAYAQNLTLGHPITPMTWGVHLYTRIQQARVFLVQPLGVRAYTQNDDERMDGLVTWTPEGPVQDLMFDITALLKTNDFELLPLERKLAAITLVTRWALSGKYAKAAAEVALDCQEELKTKIVRLETEIPTNQKFRETVRPEIAEYMTGLLSEACALGDSMDMDGVSVENAPVVPNHSFPALTGTEGTEALHQRYIQMYTLESSNTEIIQLQVARLQYRAVYMLHPLKAYILGKDRFQTTYYVLGGGVGTIVAYRGTFFPSYDPHATCPLSEDIEAIPTHANQSALMTGDTEGKPYSSYINVQTGQIPPPNQWTVFDDIGSLANLLQSLNSKGRDEAMLHDNLQEYLRFVPLIDTLYKHGVKGFNHGDVRMFEPAHSSVVDGLSLVAMQGKPEPKEWRKYIIEGLDPLYYDHMIYHTLEKEELKEWMTSQILQTDTKASMTLYLQGMRHYLQCHNSHVVDTDQVRCTMCAEVVEKECYHCRFCHRTLSGITLEEQKEHVDNCNERELNTKFVYDDIGVMDLSNKRMTDNPMKQEDNISTSANNQNNTMVDDEQPSIKQEEGVSVPIKEEEDSAPTHESNNIHAAKQEDGHNPQSNHQGEDDIDQTKSWNQVESTKELVEYEKHGWTVQRQDMFKNQENSLATNTVEIYMARSLLLDMFRGLPEDALNVLESTASEWKTQAKFACTFHGIAQSAAELAAFVKPSYLRPGFERLIWEAALKDTISFSDQLWRITELDHTLVLNHATSKKDRCVKCGRREDAANAFVSCEGCSATYHLYCGGLSSFPRNIWFCISCRKLKTLENRKEKERSLLKEQERVLRTEERKQQLSEQRAAANALRKEQDKLRKEQKLREEQDRKAREALELEEPRKRQRATSTLYDAFGEQDDDEDDEDEESASEGDDEDTESDEEAEEEEDEAYTRASTRGGSRKKPSSRSSPKSKKTPTKRPPAKFVVESSEEESEESEAPPLPPPPKPKAIGRPLGRQTKKSSFVAEDSEESSEEAPAVIISSRGRVAKKRTYTEAESEETESSSEEVEAVVVPKKGRARILDDDDED